MKDGRSSRPTETPENHTRAILSLSRRYASTSVFPGHNYVDLGEWMLQDRAILDTTTQPSKSPLFACKSDPPHDLVVIYCYGDKKWHVQKYSQEQHQTLPSTVDIAAGDAGQIVFIRGFISPRWVSALGCKYNIDPEYWRRHMDFLSVNVSDVTKLLFAKLLVEAAWYQKERGLAKHFDGFFDTALGICESSNHIDRDTILADLYFCLGAISMDASDFNASKIYKEKSFDLVYKICKEIGVEDERLYLAYAERGISRTQDQRYSEGEADLKEALRLRRSFSNYIRRAGEANLSWALLPQGKYEECNTLLLQSLALREETLGKDDRESVRTGLILYVLGNLRAAQGRWEESHSYHQRTWRHMRETVGYRDSLHSPRRSQSCRTSLL